MAGFGISDVEPSESSTRNLDQLQSKIAEIIR
jgi:hypothetical protein